MRPGSSIHLVRQAGVGLVEVMVAVLVLSIGLLGLAGLQLRTLRNNASALERGVAVVESHAIADAMRADRVAADNDAFNIALADDPPSGATFPETVLRAWRNNLENALGEGATGQVNCNGYLCTIIVQWNDARATEGSDTQQLITQVQL